MELAARLPERLLADWTALSLVNENDSAIDVLSADEVAVLARPSAFDVLLLAINVADPLRHNVPLPDSHNICAGITKPRSLSKGRKPADGGASKHSLGIQLREGTGNFTSPVKPSEGLRLRLTIHNGSTMHPSQRGGRLF
jgi:hypothetical protein